MSNKKGLLALSPLFLLIVLIVAFTVYSVDSSHQDTSLSLTVAFMISSIYAVAISGGMPVRKRVDTYSKGAGANNLMLMLWIYRCITLHLDTLTICSVRNANFSTFKGGVANLPSVPG